MARTAPAPVCHLTTQELADRLGVAAITVRIWRQHGNGPAYIRLGRGVRYPLAEVEAWEKRRLITPAST